MDLDLKGKKAIVIGGTRGIGRAIAEGLAGEGCSVGVCARTPEHVASTVRDLESKGVQAIGRAVDVADHRSLEAFVRETSDALGGLDVYVSNATSWPQGNDEDSWRKGVEIDILGTMFGCEAAVPYLQASGAGALIVVGTVSALEAVGPRRAYNSVKAAILPYVKLLARTLAEKNVRCNVVSPGMIFFEGGIWDLVKQRAPARYEEAVGRNPMGRMGTPQEVANAVLFLASPRAGFISGTNLLCDGARTQNVQY